MISRFSATFSPFVLFFYASESSQNLYKLLFCICFKYGNPVFQLFLFPNINLKGNATLKQRHLGTLIKFMPLLCYTIEVDCLSNAIILCYITINTLLMTRGAHNRVRHACALPAMCKTWSKHWSDNVKDWIRDYGCVHPACPSVKEWSDISTIVIQAGNGLSGPEGELERERLHAAIVQMRMTF